MLALLASPLAAALCAAGACPVEPAAESHCAMARECSETAVDRSPVDCCGEVAAPDPATVTQAQPVVTIAVVAGPVPAPDSRLGAKGSAPEVAAARGSPNERLHRLGALLL
jgi:hypothetical protein